MPADPQTLITAGRCYECYGSLDLYWTMKLQLLANISLSVNSSNDVTPQGLMAAGKCYECYTTGYPAEIMELVLLSQISGSP